MNSLQIQVYINRFIIILFLFFIDHFPRIISYVVTYQCLCPFLSVQSIELTFFFPLKTKDLCQTLSKDVNTSEAMAAHLCSSELRGSGNSSLRFRGTAHEFNFWQLEVHMNGRPEVIKLVNARGENVGLIQPSHIILILHGRCKVCQIQFSLKFCSAKLALLNPHVAPVAALKAVTSQ